MKIESIATTSIGASASLFLSRLTYPRPLAIVSSISSFASGPLRFAITRSGLTISISPSTLISPALTTLSPTTSIYACFGSNVSELFLITTFLMFIMISVTSSFTPGIELNSCKTPFILTWLTAVPGNEESIILLSELPSVIP